MSESIFSGYGVEILKRGGRFFIRYDAGGIAVQMREDEISEAEAAVAQESEKGAYDVILASQRRWKSSEP